MPSQRTVLSLLVSLSLSACAGSLDRPERFVDAATSARDAPFATAPPPAVLAARCGGCHGASAPMAGLDLVSGDVAARLRSARASCGEALLDPAAPERSLFLDKVEAASPRCGARMPIGTPLDATELASVRSWVLAVAR